MEQRAIFVNVAAAMISVGASPVRLLWQADILSVGMATALGVTLWLRATLGYVAAVLWALVGVGIGAAQRHSPDW